MKRNVFFTLATLLVFGFAVQAHHGKPHGQRSGKGHHTQHDNGRNGNSKAHRGSGYYAHGNQRGHHNTNHGKHGYYKNHGKQFSRHGRNYYYNNGRYYNAHNRGQLVRAPYGHRVRYIQHGCANINYRGRMLYFDQGTFYRFNHGYYVVVAPPVGAIVGQLPYYAEPIFIRGERLFEYAGILYKKIHTHRGFAFKVVGELNY